MAAANEEREVGFEEGRLWLPSHVLNEAYHAKEHISHVGHRRHHTPHRHHHHSVKLPAEPVIMQSRSSSSSSYNRAKTCNNWSSGGQGGLQAVFLDSGQKSGGTGVFLPQRAGTKSQPTKKPGCAPVLLPARVVQALNLNVHALGLKISPQQDSKICPKCGECNNSSKSKFQKDNMSMQRCVDSQNEAASPELFLPKEWTY